MFDVDDDRNPEEKKNGFVFDAIDEGVSTRAIDGITCGRELCYISLTFTPSILVQMKSCLSRITFRAILVPANRI